MCVLPDIYECFMEVSYTFQEDFGVNVSLEQDQTILSKLSFLYTHFTLLRYAPVWIHYFIASAHIVSTPFATSYPQMRSPWVV